MIPKGKSGKDSAVPAVFLGYASVQGLEVGGGPVIPDTGPVPPDPPIDVPPSQPEPGLAVVIKPAPATGGWGCAIKDEKVQWFFAPGQSGAGPKR